MVTDTNKCSNRIASRVAVLDWKFERRQFIVRAAARVRGQLLEYSAFSVGHIARRAEGHVRAGVRASLRVRRSARCG